MKHFFHIMVFSLSSLSFGDCAQMSSSVLMEKHSEVFIGRAGKTEGVKNPFPRAKVPAQKTKFDVLVQFKGADTKKIEVVSIPNSSVSPNFSETGSLFLVYANKGEGGQLWANGCATIKLSNLEQR